MELIKLAYTGRKPFNDKRHGSFHTWQPDEEKLVSHMAAKKLLKYAEFSVVKAKAGKASATEKAAEKASEDAAENNSQPTQQDDELAQRASALAAIESQKQTEQQERSIVDNMLMDIGNWDKDQLKDYAAKYDVNLNKSRALQSLREEVAGLVQTRGVL